MIAAILLASAVMLPTDRSYVLAETDKPATEAVQCAEAFFDKGGTATIEQQPYGQRVDFRFGNLGGTVKEPTMSFEVHDGEKRTLLLYGFGAYRGATKNIWKQMSKKCWPELFDAQLVKPN